MGVCGFKTSTCVRGKVHDMRGFVLWVEPFNPRSIECNDDVCADCCDRPNLVDRRTVLREENCTWYFRKAIRPTPIKGLLDCFCRPNFAPKSDWTGYFSIRWLRHCWVLVAKFHHKFYWVGADRTFIILFANVVAKRFAWMGSTVSCYSVGWSDWWVIKICDGIVWKLLLRSIALKYKFNVTT